MILTEAGQGKSQTYKGIPGKWTIGTTKRSIHTRIKERERHCRLKQPEKSAVAEHALEQTGHEILFQNTEILDNTSNHYVRLHREAIEIHKHQKNFNKKEESLKLNKTWLPALKNTACKRSRTLPNHKVKGITTINHSDR